MGSMRVESMIGVSMGDHARVRVGDRVELSGRWYGREHQRGEVVRVAQWTSEVDVRMDLHPVGLPLQVHVDDLRVLDAVESLAELDSQKGSPG